MLTKLTIINGIVQDTEIMGIPVKVKIVQPHGVANVRTLKPMPSPIGITNHNTANTSPTAGDELHATYLQNLENADKEYKSVHFFVDEDSITQCVPINEQCYHAGDGKGPGNSSTIGVEICENGNTAVAEANAIKLNAALILTMPQLKVYKHQDWSGKICPRVILARPNGWAQFTTLINLMVDEAKAPVVTPPAPTPTHKPEPAKAPKKTRYRVHAIGKGWLDWIEGYNEVNGKGYAGWPGYAIDAIQIKDATYRVQTEDGRWYNWITGYNEVDSKGYAGVFSKKIIAVQVKAKTYRVGMVTQPKKYLGWITNYNENLADGNGYAGNKKPIDRLQIK